MVVKRLLTINFIFLLVLLMENTNHHNRISYSISFRSILKDKSLRQEFYAEIFLINFNRLRIFGYFLLVLGSVFVATDLFMEDFWKTSEIPAFMALDFTMVIVSTAIILVSHFRPPKTISDIRLWHHVYFYVYLFFHFSWGVGVSVIEAKTSLGFPTFLIGVFSAATIFLLRAIPFLILLLLSVFSLFTGLILTGVEVDHIVTQYYPTIILILIAWFVSLAMLNTRMKSFITKKKIEKTLDSLDEIVKERTTELQTTNEHLKDEIRERQHSEKILEKEKKKAEEADQLKSTFLANMSHEIRTPLNGIIGFGDLLRNPGLTIEKRERYAEIISSNGHQLVKLIDDLMDISMIESNQLKLNKVDFHLSHILPDAELFFTNYANIQNKPHLKIINAGFSGQDDLINSDPSRIQQVLNNLLGNAIKFTPEGEIRFGGKIDEDYALIFVEDTGIGIMPEKAETIFQRFRQGEESTSRSYGGTGLGLSISRGIIDLLEGMIWIDLSYTQGARFCFSLPTKKASEVYSSKQLDDSLKHLEQSGLMVTPQEDSSPQFLDYFSKSRNLKFRKASVSELLKLEDSALPGLYIINLNGSDDADYRLIFEQIRNIQDSYIICLINPKSGIRQSLHSLGCKLVLETPVNVNFLLAKIHSIRESGFKV
jgi:signal transduction histidine kinase